MRYAPLLLNESDRLATVAEYELKEDDNKLHLDAIVELASKFFDVPIVLVSIVEQSRQFFSARKGLEVCETGRDVSFCAHALELDDILIVPDAKLDSRFARHPLVLGEPFIRFYAGMPLVAPNGHTLGTLCIIDRRPRNGVSAQDREHLKAMAALVLDNLEVRRLAIAYRAGQTRSEQIAATRPMASSAPTTRAGSLFATPPASDCSDPKPLMAEQALVGLEALLRWRHPTEGLLPPIRFVAAIESGAFAAEVGQWLMATACTYAVELHKVLSDLIMGVNLFGAQFQNGQVATNVMEVLQQTQLPPEALEIEITENIILAHDARVLEPLRTLQELGVDIAFDDFGTGYASLSLLKRYPLTRLKIDRSFFTKICNDEADAAIVKAVIFLADKLKLQVIAEGVETVEQRDFLQRCGCGQVQSYLYGKPMAVRDLANFIQKNYMQIKYTKQTIIFLN